MNNCKRCKNCKYFRKIDKLGAIGHCRIDKDKYNIDSKRLYECFGQMKKACDEFEKGEERYANTCSEVQTKNVG